MIRDRKKRHQILDKLISALFGPNFAFQQGDYSTRGAYSKKGAKSRYGAYKRT